MLVSLNKCNNSHNRRSRYSKKLTSVATSDNKCLATTKGFLWEVKLHLRFRVLFRVVNMVPLTSHRFQTVKA